MGQMIFYFSSWKQLRRNWAVGSWQWPISKKAALIQATQDKLIQQPRV